MLKLGIICALVATASAGYASSSSGAGVSSGSGLYGTGSTYGSTYSSNYPYSNNYVGYSSYGGVPFAPIIPSPYEFQQYLNSLSAYHFKALTATHAGEGAKVTAYAYNGPSKKFPHKNKKKSKNLLQQQFAQQAAFQNAIAASNAAGFNAIRDQVLGNRYGGGYGGAGTYSGYGNGGGSYASSGGSVGSYGGTGGSGTYGGTYSSGRPAYSSGPAYSGGGNYASSGGAVGGGHQTGFAHVSPPGLNSRFGDEGIVSHSSGAPGYTGISTFSSSSSDGHRESGTSINNNGKVTTYYNRGGK